MTVLAVTTVGDSVGVILPKEILERLRVKRGDNLYAIETKNGIELTAYNSEFSKQLEIAERESTRRPATLARLFYGQIQQLHCSC